ncbi:MAG: hypothetical protein D6782_04640 [Alphaproteobacteria bacterium]|nr:MAG: hypothetical protein D6782_04640 [Alphaproteobacteria bacterium]
MGFFSHVAHVVSHVVHNPAKAVAKVAHNPASAVLNKHIRTSKLYKNVARPVIKVGTAAAVGAATGGVGLAGGALTFSGFSAAGAAAGALSSAAAGGLTSKAFSPVKDVAIPAAAGLVAGNVARGAQWAKNAQNIKRAISGIRTIKAQVQAVKQAKAKRAAVQQQAAAVRAEQQRIAKIRAEIQRIQSQTAQAQKIAARPLPKTAGTPAAAGGHDIGATVTMAAAGGLTAGPVGAGIGALAGMYLDNKHKGA